MSNSEASDGNKIKAQGEASTEIPFEAQLLAFKVRLSQRGLLAALELLNDRTT